MIYASSDLSDVIVLADEVVSDLKRWQPTTQVNTMSIATGLSCLALPCSSVIIDTVPFLLALANCVKAFAGQTINVTPATVMGSFSFTLALKPQI
jgi:hypothetical protein